MKRKTTQQEILSKFTFDPAKRGFIGVEREYFLTDAQGRPVPRSPQFLKKAGDPAWTYELSACQVEHRTMPHGRMGDLRKDLAMNQWHGELFAKVIGCELSAIEVAPADMPLDVYPDDARYAKIAPGLPEHVLRAACRVAGTHIHVGVGSMEEAIEVHNICAAEIVDLAAMGDHSDDERIRLYCTMAPKCLPLPYIDAYDYCNFAKRGGYAENPRDNWDLVRISRHGTVELRMFGVTMDVSETMSWVEAVKNLLK